MHAAKPIRNAVIMKVSSRTPVSESIVVIKFLMCASRTQPLRFQSSTRSTEDLGSIFAMDSYWIYYNF